MSRVRMSPETGPEGARATEGGALPVRRGRSRIAFLSAAVLLSLSCASREDANDVQNETFLTADTAGVEEAKEEAGLDSIPGTSWTDKDWDILQEKVRWAVGEGLANLPMGEALARLGATFVGTTYTPQTLEAAGAEHLVINLRELDCVTFIENMLALTWLIRNEGEGILQDRGRAMARFEEYLTAVRYRGGALDGYPSRLHYFTDWLADNERMGLLALRTRELGGVPDPEPIDFMSTHRDAYRQLAEPGNFEEIQRAETRLNAAGPRHYIPEASIGQVADRIANGDIIAATSTVKGLDVAHTGIALWQDGKLHLLHAPLVGKNVEISEKPLAERILDITGQDGIMVARPHEWPASNGGSASAPSAGQRPGGG